MSKKNSQKEWAKAVVVNGPFKHNQPFLVPRKADAEVTLIGK